MANTKDTIYIDVDDEITSIVDRVANSSSKIVALVLPKRAVVLQSIVNMKLLKRSADDANKQIVLITSEAGLLPIAGATGVYVAKNLQSKPEIPDSPDSPASDEDEVVEDLGGDEDDNKAGIVAGAAAVGAVAGAKRRSESAASSVTTPKANKKSKSKTTKIPNFDKFRKKTFIIIGVVILLIIAWYFAVFVMPKATITITTNTENFPANFEFTASETANTVSVENNTIPANIAVKEVDETETSGATGTKDVGTKAKGTVTIRNCSDTAVTVKSGTGVSSNNQTFITQSALALGSGNFDSGGDCKTSGTHVGAVSVVAQNNGSDYNLSSGSTYTISGFSSSVSGTGSAMTGGSSKTIKVVTNADVSAAKDKLDINEEQIKADLKQSLENDGYFVIENSFEKKNENTKSTPAVGQEASEVSVQYTADFRMVGVKKDDLKKLIEENIKDQIDTEKQMIQNDGIDGASYEITKSGDNTLVVSYDGQVGVGPDINIEQLKQDVAGKKSGETESLVFELPGVEEVNVKYSPFWVNKTPSKVNKIDIVFVSSDQ